VGADTRPDRAGEEPLPPSGMWRAVLTALESNIKTARLIAIILAFALTAAVVQTFR
jgi:uncharacterized membrane protein